MLVLNSSNLATAKAGDNIVVTVSKVDASINSAWEWGSLGVP